MEITISRPQRTTEKRTDTLPRKRIRSSCRSSAIFSGLADEFFAAFGAADADLALFAGHANHLFALGAAEIAVFPILYPRPYLPEPAVLLLPRIDVAGKGAEQVKAQQSQYQQVQQRRYDHHIDLAAAQEKRQDRMEQADDHSSDQQPDIQFVGAVASVHKTAERFT